MQKVRLSSHRRGKQSFTIKAIILLSIGAVLVGGVVSWRIFGALAVADNSCDQAQMDAANNTLSCIPAHHTNTQTDIAIVSPTSVASSSTKTASTTPLHNALSPSGEAIPAGDLPGWHQIFTEDFKSDVSLGSFPGRAYSTKFSQYPDNTPDTAGDQGAPSRYYPSKVASVHNGALNLHLHTEAGVPMAAAFLPIVSNSLYGKYSIRFRLSQPIAGFKTAWLLWPHDNNNGRVPIQGEVDFPEGYLSHTINAYMHHRVNSVRDGDIQDVFHTTATYTSWHTTSLEWTPNSINFLLDGQSIGRSTTGIPNTSMDWVIQTEACLGDRGYAPQSCPDPAASADLEIDWVAVYAYTG